MPAVGDEGPLAAPVGWPDITDELAEVRFLLLQGFEDEAAAMLVSLRARFGGHPDLENADSVPTPPVPIDAAEKRRRDQAVTVRTEPVAAAAAAAAADASRRAPPEARGATVISPAPTAPEPAPTIDPVAETPAEAAAPVDEPAPLAPRPIPGGNARNASRVPPRGLTIRSEPVSDQAGASPAVDVPPPAGRVTRPPDPSRLIATSPMPRPGPSPEDSAAETLEFDVDAEFVDGADGATDPASMSTMAGLRGAEAAASSMAFDDSGETVVDLEFERLDRTVVSRSPPAPPVFDDEPETGTTTRVHESEAAATSEGTVIARAPSAPAPWREAAAPAPMPRTTVVPTDAQGPSQPAPFGGAPPPGSTLVPGTTPPTGGFAEDDHGDEAATIALPSLTEASTAEPPTPTMWAPPPTPAVTGQTAPPGAILEAPAPSPPTREPARAPARGRGRKDARPGGVRLVMLGSRGESVAERTIEAGGYLDLGREAGQPWSDDAFIEPMHARFISVDGGVRVEELVPTGAVFLRIVGRRPLGEHDQVRVGQSLLTYRRPDGDPQAGPWGSVVMHIAPDGAMQVIPLGNSGVTVGREFGEITLTGDTFVSSTHCRVITDPNGIHIEDLESSNGTYVRMRSGEQLTVGQCVLIGQTQFVVRKR